MAAATVTLPPGPRQPRGWQVARWIARPEAMLEEGAARFGDVWTFQGPFGPVVLVSDPDLIRAVLTAPASLLRAGEANRPLAPAVGERSVLLLDGPEHLRQRRLLLPPFQGEALRGWEPTMRSVAEADVASWPRGEPFALETRTRAITLDIVLRVVFGIVDEARLGRLRSLFARLLPARGGAFAMLPALRRELGGLTPWGRFVRVRAEIDAILLDEIRRRRAAGEQRDDVLSLLIAARDEDGSPLSDGDLRDELKTLLLAGHETTAVTAAWATDLLLHHPEALARAREDAPFLDGAIHETLRLRPPLPFVVRRVVGPEPFALGGWSIPAGVRIAPAIWLAGRRADRYPQPRAFRPERFVGRRPDTYSWLPFGGGIRRCVGAQFALTELRAILPPMLEAGLRPVGERPVRSVRRAIVLGPRGGPAVVASS